MGPWMPGSTLGDASGIEHAGHIEPRGVLAMCCAPWMTEQHPSLWAPYPSDISRMPEIGSGRIDPVDGLDTVELVIAEALQIATRHDERAVVERLAAERGARRMAQTVPAVVDIAAARARRQVVSAAATLASLSPSRRFPPAFDRARRDDHCCDLGARGRSAAPVALAA